jgi:phage protein D
LTKGDFEECEVEADDRAEHKKARAHHHDRGEAKRKKEEADGGAGGEFTLRHTFQDKDVAEHAAKAKKRQLERQAKTLTGKGPGNVHIMAGKPLVTVIGAALYDGVWRIKTATHTLTKAEGYKTAVNAGTDEKGEEGGEAGA